MPDLLTVVLPSLAAIVVMVLIIRAVGISRPAKLDEALVRQSVNEHYEGATIRRIVPGRDGKSALAYLDGEPALVLVRAMGDRTSVRAISRDVLKALSEKDDALIFVLHDFTWPKTALALDSDARAAEKQAIERALGLAQKEAHTHA